jgi:hypothetical protein
MFFHAGGLEELREGGSLVSGLSLKNPSSFRGGCSEGGRGLPCAISRSVRATREDGNGSEVMGSRGYGPG